ncbi:hypothetical protein [Pseudonocardia sp. NPDC049154]|uniref:hypothetical protein n=1 Tax=Pseudonocardia sp. NPDC049154 TaxID=3155501 RepID=UPI0033F07DD0
MLEQSSAPTRAAIPDLPSGPRFTVTANAGEWRLTTPPGAAPPSSDQVRTLLREWLRTLDWPRTQTSLVLDAVAEAVDALDRSRDAPVPGPALDGLRIGTTEISTRRTRRLRIVVAAGGEVPAGPDPSPLHELMDEVVAGPGATISMLSRVIPRW